MSWLDKYLDDGPGDPKVPGVRPDATATKKNLPPYQPTIGPALPGNTPLPRGQAERGPVHLGDDASTLRDLIDAPLTVGGPAGVALDLFPATMLARAARSGVPAVFNAGKATAEGHYLTGPAGAALAALPFLHVPEGVARQLQQRLGDRWAVLTGENPGGIMQSAAQNKTSRISLAKYLDRHAVESTPVTGAYTDDKTGQLLTERSRLLKDVDPSYAEKIGRTFGQNSVLTPEGLHDLSSGTVNPSKGVSLTTEPPYFQLPGGKRLQSDLDFGSSIPSPAPKPLGGPAVVVKDEYRPTRRQVFDPDPKLGEYREPAPVPSLPAGPRAQVSPIAARIAEDPSVEAQLRGDVDQGLKLGGRTWYGLGAVRNSYGEMNGPLTFKDFNMAGGAGSIQTPTHNELTNLSLLLYAKAHGIEPMEAKQIFLAAHPQEGRPFFSDQHGDYFQRAQQAGTMLPASGVGKEGGYLKVPNYYHNRMLGAEGVPLDTHEMRRLAQALGLPEDKVRQQIGVNSLSYNTATQPYRRIAQNLGLAPDQVQASRWLGGGLMTGLDSQSSGDYLQTLEDGLLYTARTRGKAEAPADLRKLWQQIAQGQEFFAPYFGSGGFPVRR